MYNLAINTANLVISSGSFFSQYLVAYGGGLGLQCHDVSGRSLASVVGVGTETLVFYHHNIRQRNKPFQLKRELIASRGL